MLSLHPFFFYYYFEFESSVVPPSFDINEINDESAYIAVPKINCVDLESLIEYKEEVLEAFKEMIELEEERKLSL